MKANFAVADIDLIGGRRAMLVDSITRGNIHTFVRPIVMWHVPDDKRSRTYSYVAAHGTWKCGLPQWGPWLQSITGGDIQTFVRQIVLWRVPDDEYSRTCLLVSSRM